MRSRAASQGRSCRWRSNRATSHCCAPSSLRRGTLARGLIERRQDLADRRIHALHLTDTGQELLDRAIAIAVAYEQELCGDLSSPEREQLLELLQRVSLQLGLAPGLHAAQGSDEMAGE